MLLRQDQLHQAKLAFLEELARRDPQWQTKMQAVREKEIKRIEQQQVTQERQLKEQQDRMRHEQVIREEQERQKVKQMELQRKREELELEN